MKIKFLAKFNINGKPNDHSMEYDSIDIIKTLERRLKTAFPNATDIRIAHQEDEQLPLAAPAKSK